LLKAPRKLGLVFFPAFDWAISSTHPEREERLLYTRDQLVEEGLLDIEGIKEYTPLIASIEDVERVHICVPDVPSRITNSHLISAGGAIAAAEIVLNKETDKSFALVRPPGHHAFRIVHGAEALQYQYRSGDAGIYSPKIRYQKVAIVDTDCHHGDGTQDIYWHDKIRFIFPSTRTDALCFREAVLSKKWAGPTPSAIILIFLCRRKRGEKDFRCA